MERVELAAEPAVRVALRALGAPEAEALGVEQAGLAPAPAPGQEHPELERDRERELERAVLAALPDPGQVLALAEQGRPEPATRAD